MLLHSLQDLLAATVEAATLLQRLADLVKQSESRIRLLSSSVTALGASSPLHEVVLGPVKEKRAALEKNELLLLSESLYFTAVLCRSASRADALKMISVLGSLTGSLSASQGEQLSAQAVFFATLSVLEQGKLCDEGEAVSLADNAALLLLEPVPLRATLRLALGLASASGGEEHFKYACEAGVFPFLVSVVQNQASTCCPVLAFVSRGLTRHHTMPQLRLRDLYIVTMHSLLTAFLDDVRGRNQVQFLPCSLSAFPHLPLLPAR